MIAVICILGLIILVLCSIVYRAWGRTKSYWVEYAKLAESKDPLDPVTMSQKERCDYFRILHALYNDEGFRGEDREYKYKLEEMYPQQTEALHLFTVDFLVREREAEVLITEILEDV